MQTKVNQFIIILFCIINFAGCSTSLKYTPTTLSENYIINEMVGIIEFQDVRKFSHYRIYSGFWQAGYKESNSILVVDERSLFGAGKAGWAYKIKNQNLSTWVTDAFKVELERSGVEIQKLKSYEQRDIRTVISGSIYQLNPVVISTYGRRVDALLQVIIDRDGIVIFDKEYMGRGKFRSGNNLNKLLNPSLQDIIKQAVPDIIKLLQE